MSSLALRSRVSKARVHRPIPPAPSRGGPGRTAEEAAILDELNRDCPAGAIESHPDEWPADVDNWHWHPYGKPLV